MGFIIVLSLFLFYKISAESPPDLCSEDKPFRSNDRYCHNFSELCLKTGDDQCNQLINMCKQCPPNNTVLIMLRKILQMSILQSNLTQQIIPNIIAQLNSTQKSVINKSNESSPTLSNKTFDILVINGILTFLVILVLVVLLLEIRFKLLTKYFKRCGEKNNLQYILLESRKRKCYKDIFNKMLVLESRFNESIENQDKNFESTFQKMIDKIYPLQSSSKEDKIVAVKFQFDGIDQEPIELYVHHNNNIVQVKQQICAKLPHAKHDDYKIMKLKYNGIILNDDNQYLLENIDIQIKL